jgi:hypothetical protein
MTKRTDWHQKLLDTLYFYRNLPFEWGTHDCALFACNTIEAMTDEDLARDFRGKYSSALQAARVIRAFTKGGDLEALAEKICSEHGLDEVPVKFAQRGDVVVLHATSNHRVALGIVGADPRYAYAPGPLGLVRVPMSEWLRAWRIT